MKKKNIFKLVCFIVMIILFIILGTKDYKTNISDNIRYSNEYKDISKNNVYKYTDDTKILEILKGGSGVILGCFPSNIWCHYYSEYLNSVAINNNLEEIYYFDFKRDRSLKNVIYNQIINKLSNYLSSDDFGKMDLYAPVIIIVKNGNVEYFLDEVRDIKGKITPSEYFTDSKVIILKNKLDKEIKAYLQKN